MDADSRTDPPADNFAVLAGAVAVHRPGDLEAKFAWATETLRAASSAGIVVYVDVGSEVLAVAGGDLAQAEELVDGPAAPVITRSLAGSEPVVAPVRGRAGLTATLLVVPVPASGGVVRGALVAALEAPEAADASARVGSAVAGHLGVALDNLETMLRLAELEAAQREVAHQLQEAVRPPMPTVEGAELGVFYLPADPGAPTGGDLYDWYLLPGGDLHLAVVDVAGKGVQATKDALAVMHAVRLLVLEGCPLKDIVERADHMLSPGDSELVASLVVARYSPDSGLLQVSGAGHPPVLLLRSGGKVEQLDLSGIPIGWPEAGSLTVLERELGRNDMAVFYTDGLVEASKDILEGLDQLERAAEEVSRYPAPFLARALVDRALAGAARRYDTLALVLRRRMPVRPHTRVLGPFLYRFSPSPAAVPLARHLLGDWLANQPVDPAERDDLLMVATELCANAVRAASGDPGSVALRALMDDDAVVLEVEDDGPGVDVERVREPDPEAEAGRGLFLVSALCDEVTSWREDGRTVVRCVRRAAVPELGES